VNEKKKRKKLKRKDSQLAIRINGEERDHFLDLCEQLDTSAAQEIRRFIRSFVSKHDHNEEAYANTNSPLAKRGSSAAKKRD
jgi:ribbon-helix-helix protein